MKLLLIGLVVFAGLGNPLQSAANAALSKTLGSPVVAAACILSVALASVGVVAVFAGFPIREAAGKAGEVPWWAWVGGVAGVAFVFASAIATKQIGSGPFTVISLVTAVVLSIALDHFGLLGLEKHPATWPRLLGGALAIAGVALVGFF